LTKKGILDEERQSMMSLSFFLYFFS